MGTGKTTAAEYLQGRYGMKRIAFADSLKEIAKRVTPDGQIEKVRDRALLQFLGTEYFRTIDTEYWTKAWKAKAVKALELDLGVVNDDCRFSNEVGMIKAMGGTVVYLTLPDDLREGRITERDGSVTTGLKGHASENVSDLRFMCDTTLINDGSMECFRDNLDRLYEQVIKGKSLLKIDAA